MLAVTRATTRRQVALVTETPTEVYRNNNVLLHDITQLEGCIGVKEVCLNKVNKLFEALDSYMLASG